MLDLEQIVENSITYNGPSSPYTQTAQLMKAQGEHRLQEVTDAAARHLCHCIMTCCCRMLDSWRSWRSVSVVLPVPPLY